MVELRCEGRGIPAPTLRMYHNTLSITSASGDRSVFQKNLVLNEATKGDYFCLGSNTIVSPEGVVTPQVAYKIISLELLPSSTDSRGGLMGVLLTRLREDCPYSDCREIFHSQLGFMKCCH